MTPGGAGRADGRCALDSQMGSRHQRPFVGCVETGVARHGEVFLLVTHFAAHRVWPRSTLVADVCRCMIHLPVADVAPSRRGVLVRRTRRPGGLDRQLVERRRSHPIQPPLPADATRYIRTSPSTGRSVERCGMTSVARRTRRLTSRSRPGYLRDDRPQEVLVQQRQRPHTRAESATRFRAQPCSDIPGPRGDRP